MTNQLDQIIRTAASGPREDLIAAACRIRELCIDLRVQELAFSDPGRNMIRELFSLQIILNRLLENYELALSPRSQETSEKELREGVAQLASALKLFETRIHYSLASELKRGPDFHADVGILTVIPKELRAVQKAFQVDENTRHMTKAGTLYWTFSRAVGGCQRDVSVALGLIGEAGNYDAAAATTRMIGTFNPKLMLLIGIAAGIRGKTKIGEVVLSDRVVGYEFGSLEANQDGGISTIRARPEITKPSHRMTQLVGAYDLQAARERGKRLFLAREWNFPTGTDHDEHEWERNVADDVIIRSATIASGEKLLRDPTKLISLRENIHGKIEIGEMEASGFSKSCEAERVDWMVIRGISDFGDSLKDDRFHDFAAQTAAVMALDFLEYWWQEPTVQNIR